MLARAKASNGATPTYFFTSDDVALLTKETGLEDSMILQWAANLRWKTAHNYLGGGGVSIEDYLKASESWPVSPKPPPKVNRFYVKMFRASQELVENFTRSRLRKGSDVPILFMLFALNEKKGLAEGFVEVCDQVFTTAVHDQLAGLGACTVTVDTFQNNDGNFSAASALNRVRSTAKKEGFSLVEHGVCNPKLRAKADRLMEAERKRYCHRCGADQCNEMDEFDVVKKRRLMDAAGPADDGEDCLEAHAYFKQFEADVLGALMKSLAKVHEDENQNYRRELLEEEAEDNDGTVAPKARGGVYMAKSDALPHVIKIGATRRAGPEQRLYELSRCVPKPFQLLKWIPDRKPFALENLIHQHFAKRRLKETGAGTEFFEIEDKDIDTMVEALHLQS